MSYSGQTEKTKLKEDFNTPAGVNVPLEQFQEGTYYGA
jgi:hypothetical protein